MTASTFSSNALTIFPKSFEPSVTDEQLVFGAPSCTNRTTMLAPSAFSASASLFAAAAMSVTVMSAIPAGETNSSRCSVTAPTKPTVTPFIFLVHTAGNAGFPVALNFTFAPRYAHSAPPYGLVVALYGAITRFTRSL